VPLANRAAVNGEDHYGLLLTSDKSMPRRLGHVVDALHDFLTRHQAKDSCRSKVLWLSASSP
jgi:hypothetical protein